MEFGLPGDWESFFLHEFRCLKLRTPGLLYTFIFLVFCCVIVYDEKNNKEEG